MMADVGYEDSEPRILSSFEKLDDTVKIIGRLLAVPLSVDPTSEDDKEEDEQLRRLCLILSEYQEQPYLLDPHLESLITPIINVLQRHAREFTSASESPYSSARVERLALLLYNFVKLRGYKTVVRFFPHEVADLSVAVRYMSSDGPVTDAAQWALRYLVLLWLSLVCMLPFDLAQFDDASDGRIARELQSIGKRELDKAGLERESAALMLSRLYARKDTRAMLEDFIIQTTVHIRGPEHILTCVGTLRVYAEMAKSAPDDLLREYTSRIRENVISMANEKTYIDNSLIRKYRIKVLSRLATRILPTKSRNFRQAKVLASGSQFTTADEEDEDIDVPEEVESTFEDLFEALQDKDTSVRWSAAKGLSRISERLPHSFVDQVLENILGFFTIHSTDGNLADLPVAAEQPWHGASLACAELARRSLISETCLEEILQWMSKALFFDIRKNTFSVGSNVRDAASYVIWALARSGRKELLEPHAKSLARKLVCVALFDREIHIRRAASAAFQENVGRMGLFPHGIPILAMTDFYSVSIRRNAFLVAAPQVAAFEEYRQPILDHLLSITLRHWDDAMRRLGAQSIRKICEIDLPRLGLEMINRVSEHLNSVDNTDVHGGLLALSELADAFKEIYSESSDRLRQKIFDLLEIVPSKTILSPRNHLITEAACYVISNSLSSRDVSNPQSPTNKMPWMEIIEYALRYRNSDVQEAAARAMGSMSRLKDCSEDFQEIFTLTAELRTSPPQIQRSIAGLLGALDYTNFRNGLDLSLQSLLGLVNSSSSSRDVEARRNAFSSLATSIASISPRMPDYISPETLNVIFDAFFVGLDDYTINERGDVGSWVRIACIKGLGTIFQALLTHASSIDHLAARRDPGDNDVKFADYLPQSTFHKAIEGVLKQGVERLDNVRQCAGDVFRALLSIPFPTVSDGEGWEIRQRSLFIELVNTNPVVGWNDGSWLYPRAVRFLEVEEYRLGVLKGLVLSIGSKTGSIQRPASTAILNFAKSLPSTGALHNSSAAPNYSYGSLVVDLLDLTKVNPAANNIVVPVLQTFNVLLEGDALSALNDELEDSLRDLLKLATKNIERLKSVQRVEESMKIVVNFLHLQAASLQEQATLALKLFLLHKFPKIRSDAAEAIYLTLQTRELEYDDEADELLLETEWSMNDLASLTEPAARVIACLQDN